VARWVPQTPKVRPNDGEALCLIERTEMRVGVSSATTSWQMRFSVAPPSEPEVERRASNTQSTPGARP